MIVTTTHILNWCYIPFSIIIPVLYKDHKSLQGSVRPYKDLGQSGIYRPSIIQGVVEVRRK